MSKVIQKTSWTGRVNECVVNKGSDGGLNVELRGGAENGEFTYVSDVRDDAVQYRCGRLSSGELLLELQGLSVSGLPLYDVLTVLKNCKGPVRMKTVRQGEFRGRERKLRQRERETLRERERLTDFTLRNKIRTLSCTDRRWR